MEILKGFPMSKRLFRKPALFRCWLSFFKVFKKNRAKRANLRVFLSYINRKVNPITTIRKKKRGIKAR